MSAGQFSTQITAFVTFSIVTLYGINSQKPPLNCNQNSQSMKTQLAGNALHQLECTSPPCGETQLKELTNK